MGAIESAIDGLRDPEYTGENRCLPCTVVNLVIAAVLAQAVVLVFAWTSRTTLAVPAGVVVFLLACVPIVLRGYLVPGTPTLTKRYFPPWLLAFFGKEPASPGLAEAEGAQGSDGSDRFDVEERLLAAGALEPLPGADDLTLSSDLREDWHAEMDRVREDDADRERLAEVLGADEAELTVATYGESYRATIEGRAVGTWESHAAFVADVAAEPLLAERVDDWNDLDVPARGRLLNGLRLFLESCPDCGGELSFGTNTVESCCSTHEVAALTCQDCEERVFESQPL